MITAQDHLMQLGRLELFSCPLSSKEIEIFFFADLSNYSLLIWFPCEGVQQFSAAYHERFGQIAILIASK